MQFLLQWRLPQQQDELWDACYAIIAHALLRHVYNSGTSIAHCLQDAPVLCALLAQAEAACLLARALLALPNSEQHGGATKPQMSNFIKSTSDCMSCKRGDSLVKEAILHARPASLWMRSQGRRNIAAQDLRACQLQVWQLLPLPSRSMRRACSRMELCNPAVCRAVWGQPSGPAGWLLRAAQA